MRDVPPRPSDQIIQADDAVAQVNKTIAKMRSDEPGRAGDEMPHAPF